MTPVDLTLAEVAQAHYIACQRVLANIADKRKDVHGREPGASDVHLMGARGEMAVAKFLGVFWSGNLGNFEASDVAECVEVRTTFELRKRLIIHREHPDLGKHHLPFVLVHSCQAPRMLLRGWMYGKDALREEWWADPQKSDRWAYFVPHEALNPSMEELRALVMSGGLK